MPSFPRVPKASPPRTFTPWARKASIRAARKPSAPSDEIAARVVKLVTAPGESRERLSAFAYTTLEPGNPLGLLQEALELTKKHVPLEKRLRQARKEGLIRSDYLGLQIDEAEKAQVISKAEARGLREYHDKVAALLAVDDFTTDQLARVNPKEAETSTAKKASKKKKTSGKKTSTVKRVASKKVTSKKKTKAS